jgi:prolyl 4-hydroxylase
MNTLEEGSCQSDAARNISIEEAILASDDPNLKEMPDHNGFKAYVRPDISAFYQEKPGRKPSAHRFNGQAGKFINMTPERFNLYWDSGRGHGHFTGSVNGWEATGTATFPTHKFFYGKTPDPNQALCSFEVKEGTSVYFCDPYGDDHGEPGRASVQERRNLNDLSSRDRDFWRKHKYNIEFGEDYKAFTNGVEWLGMYGRDPPRHKIWAADYFGQEHHVTTKETQFIEQPPWDELPSITPAARKEDEEVPLKQYRSPESTMNITLKAVSCAPRIFEMRNFISHAEADHILMLSNRTHELHRSSTGDSKQPSEHDNTRTSENTWVYRHETPIIDAAYRRVADVLQVDEALLRQRQNDEWPDFGTKSTIAEPLQLVHYFPGQEYTSHHDFGYDRMSSVHQPSRSINVLLYLNDVEEGGETSFPRWFNAETTGGLDVKPEKGKAVLFYMLLPDGNSDDLSQHAALPVIKGEKWMSNLWIWDPYKD